MSLLPGSLLSRERDSSDSHRNAEGHSTLKTASGGRAGETGDQLPEAGPWPIPSLRWLCGCRAWGAPENSELGAKAVGRWGGCKSYSGESVEEGDALARCLPHRTILQAQGGHELELGEGAVEVGGVAAPCGLERERQGKLRRSSGEADS